MSSDANQIKKNEDQSNKDEQNDPKREEIEFCVEWNLEDELKTNEKLRREDIDSLRKFAITLPHVDDSLITETVVVAILHSAEYDLENARTVIKKYFETRLSTPEVFTGRDLDSEEIQSALEVGYYVPLPRKTKEGYRVVLQGLRNTDVSLFNHLAMCKVQTLIMDSVVHSDPTCAGWVFVCDMHGISMGHMWRQSLSLGKKLMSYSQEGAPLIIRHLHVLNTSSLAHKIMRLFRPFISQRLWDMLHIYTPDEIDKFWEMVPKECMPKDYGGDLPEIETHHQDLIKWLGQASTKLAVI